MTVVAPRETYDQLEPTFMLAAQDSPYHVKRRANWVVPSLGADRYIQAAINRLGSGGGTVFLAEGTYNLGAAVTITRNNVRLEGQGSGTIVRAQSGAEGIILFDFGDNSATLAHCGLSRMLLSSVNQKTSNASIRVRKGFKLWFTEMRVEKAYRAIHFYNTTEVWLRDSDIRNTSEHGVYIENDLGLGVDWYLTNITMDNPDVVNAGSAIFWDGGETLMIQGAEIIRFDHGLQINPAAGRQSRWGFIANAIFDTCSDNGIKVTKTGTGDVAGVTFVNCWCGSNTNYGVLVEQPAGAGTVTGVRFEGCKVVRNGLAGYRLAGGTNVEINGCDVISNSNTVAHARHGIEIVAAVDEWSVTNCLITNGWEQGASNHDYAIHFDGAADKFIIANNDMRGNFSGAIQGLPGVSATQVCRNNLGFVTEASGTGTINNGATTAVITHGLSYTPRLQDISIVLGENPTNDPGIVWVSTITATQFTVNCRADPGASNLDFAWHAAVL